MTTTQPISFRFEAPAADEQLHHADRAYRQQTLADSDNTKTVRIPVVAS